jgi:chromosome segregation ATPase
MITKEKIWEAADALDAEGFPPTLAAVRKRLGGGSFTTISEAMQAWKAKKAAGVPAPAEPLPAAVREQVEAAGAAIWKAAAALAAERLEADRAALAEVKSDLEQRASEAEAAADEQDQRAERAEAEAARLAAELEQARAAAQEAQALAGELKATREHLQTERDRSIELRAELDAARSAEREARDAAARLQGKLEALELQLQKAQPQGKPKV